MICRKHQLRYPTLWQHGTWCCRTHAVCNACGTLLLAHLRRLKFVSISCASAAVSRCSRAALQHKHHKNTSVCCAKQTLQASLFALCHVALADTQRGLLALNTGQSLPPTYMHRRTTVLHDYRSLVHQRHAHR
jgi:hypothetical protein